MLLLVEDSARRLHTMQLPQFGFCKTVLGNSKFGSKFEADTNQRPAKNNPPRARAVPFCFCAKPTTPPSRQKVPSAAEPPAELQPPPSDAPAVARTPPPYSARRATAARHMAIIALPT